MSATGYDKWDGVQSREHIRHGKTCQTQISDSLQVVPGDDEINDQGVNNDYEEAQCTEANINCYHRGAQFGLKHVHLVAGRRIVVCAVPNQ